MMMDEQAIADDKEWISMLLAKDGDLSKGGWSRVKVRVVLPVASRCANLVKDLHLSQDDLINMICKKLVADGKLALFGFRCPLHLWMQTCLLRELIRAHRKFQPAVDPGVLAGVLVDERSAPWEEVTRKEELALMARDFVTLWKKNPLQSYVLLLRTKTRMSSAQIQRLLNVSSVSHVDKMTERARKEIGQLASVWLN